MKLVLFIALLLLAGCANWDWKQSVRSALEFRLQQRRQLRRFLQWPRV